MNLNSKPSPKPGNLLWGIYHTDREYARELGDPLRTVVEAADKSSAEEAARKLGLDAPWAHPTSADQFSQAKWFEQGKARHQDENEAVQQRSQHVTHHRVW
jgi:hypothetical protein